jgi:antitoxin ParD1/3/4
MNPSVRAKVNWCRLARVASNRGSSIDGQAVHWHNLPLHLSEEIGMPTRNVVLTNYQASFVERLVSTGRYQNASEVLREGLRMVEQREAEDASRLEALRNAVRVGIADMEQGRYATFESGAQLRGHLASVASKAIAGA